MKRIFLLLIACCFLSTISAQSTRKISELEAKRKELHQQIAESETLLQSTKKDGKRIRMGKQAQKNIQRYSREEVMKLWDELFNTLTTARP